LGGRYQEDSGLRPARQKVSETSFQQKKAAIVVHVCNPSYIGGICRKIEVQTDLGKNTVILSEKQ
jgi:hypothetical protein